MLTNLEVCIIPETLETSRNIFLAFWTCFCRTLEVSVEAAIIKVYRTRVDCAPDKFSKTLPNISDLIGTTITNLATASKLDFISQRLLSIFYGRKSEYKRLSRDLPMGEYAVKRKYIFDAPKTTCVAAAPCDTSFRPEVVILPINKMPTQCLIVSGSAISIMRADYGIH
uniref:Uncharacterized protein n=1 Tax=Strongyloides papillosus TaxID=174720 RepID=A0A0N5BL26_STREA